MVRSAASDRKLTVILQEYMKSLKLLCGFSYVSAAAILEPDEEAVRYFLVFGTNHLRGIEVFKNAEQAAARMQDKVRFETIFGRKAQGEFTLGASTPKTRIVYQLRDRNVTEAMENVIKEILDFPKNRNISYRSLFARAMEFPLVTPDDLANGLKSLPSIQLCIDGKHRVPSVEKDRQDHVLVLDRNALEIQLALLRTRQKPDQGNLL